MAIEEFQYPRERDDFLGTTNNMELRIADTLPADHPFPDSLNSLSTDKRLDKQGTQPTEYEYIDPVFGPKLVGPIQLDGSFLEN
jgi:hypothetical protein